MKTYYKAQRPGLLSCDHKHNTIAAAQKCGGKSAQIFRFNPVTQWLAPVTADDRKAEEIRQESRGVYVYED